MKLVHCVVRWRPNDTKQPDIGLIDQVRSEVIAREKFLISAARAELKRLDINHRGCFEVSTKAT